MVRALSGSRFQRGGQQPQSRSYLSRRFEPLAWSMNQTESSRSVPAGADAQVFVRDAD